MTNDLIIDLDTFKQTADVLAVINPRGHSAEGLCQWMKDTAERQHRDEPGYLGYLSTGGFEICFWRDERDEHGKTHARASVTAYSVARFLKDREITS